MLQLYNRQVPVACQLAISSELVTLLNISYLVVPILSLRTNLLRVFQNGGIQSRSRHSSSSSSSELSFQKSSLELFHFVIRQVSGVIFNEEPELRSFIEKLSEVVEVDLGAEVEDEPDDVIEAGREVQDLLG